MVQDKDRSANYFHSSLLHFSCPESDGNVLFYSRTLFTVLYLPMSMLFSIRYMKELRDKGVRGFPSLTLKERVEKIERFRKEQNTTLPPYEVSWHESTFWVASIIVLHHRRYRMPSNLQRMKVAKLRTSLHAVCMCDKRTG